VLLRWWHEKIRDKPFRPALEWLLVAWCTVVGLLGQWIKCCWHAAMRHPPPRPLHDISVQRLLCLRPDRIGDVVLLTPALVALREQFPSAEITLLVSEKARMLIEGHPAIDNVVTVRDDRVLDFWSDRHTLSHLRQQGFDVIIVFESVWSCALLAWWLGGIVRLGYDTQGTGFLFTHALPYPYRWEKCHQVVVNAQLVQALGCSETIATGPLSIRVSSVARSKALQWLESQGLGGTQPLVLIHPGSRSRFVQWAPTRFGVVAEWLHHETPACQMILCGPGEEAIVNRMRSALSFTPPVVQGLTIAEVAGLMSWCCLFIGNATGTTHLAAAVGPLAIMIIGGTHPLDCPERWRPWGEQHVVVHKRPMDVIGRETSRWLGPEGLDHITPADVIAVLQQHLQRLNVTSTKHD